VKVRFEAPAQTAFLYIRGWKKWAITNVEMDLNLDAITLRTCESVGGGQQMGVGGPTWATGPQGDACVYVVKPGDTLGYIAAKYGVSTQELVRANGIDNPDYIYVGQKFDIPGCGNQEMTMPMRENQPMDGPIIGADPAYVPSREPQVRPETAMRETTYIVQSGDILSYIAEQYGINVYMLASYNGIDNMNFIYAGQVLRIPSNTN
jgi:LysM repeat protein